MTRRKGTQVKNLAASVRARLLSRARAEGEDFNYLLTRYVLDAFCIGSRSRRIEAAFY